MRYREGLDISGVSDLHQRDVKRDQAPIMALVSFSLNRNPSANMHRARLFGYSLRLAYSGSDRLISYSLVFFIYLRYNQGECWSFLILEFLQVTIASTYHAFRVSNLTDLL